MSGLLSWPSFGSVFNGTGSAGTRRLAVILLAGVVVVGGIVAVSSIRSTEPPVSRPGPLPRVDPLPGGTKSNPQQDALGVVDNREKAQRAAEIGMSFTPVMPASRPYTANDPRPDRPTPAAQEPPRQAPPPQPVPARAAVPPVAARVIPVAAPAAPPQLSVATVQTPPRNAQEDTTLKAAIDRMMAGWGGRFPRTEIVLPPEDVSAPGGSGPGATPHGRVSGEAQDLPAAASPVSQVSASAQHGIVLVPAGHGVYAHTVLAANSDAVSPVVLQADSGPLIGDRMIGSFARERNRLVIRVSKVIHRNQEIGVEGVVVAPASMEVGVASSVDQNYLERFALPAAAAFIQGLGQAIAQSNSTSVLGPLGTVTATNKLNFDQQLGIAAGVASAQIGSELQQSTPHGPTVHLDVGSSVGVLFLANVVANP